MSIAEHAPSKLHAKNKGLLKMSKSQLHDFAATKRSSLPSKKGAPKRPQHHMTSAYRGGGQE